MLAVNTQEPVLADPNEHGAFLMLESFFQSSGRSAIPKLVGPNGEEIQLPDSLYHLLRQLVHDMAQGRAVMLVSNNQTLTTQQAAGLLNVSRPHLVKLLEEDKIPFTRTGTHRRIRFKDLMAYKQHRDAERKRGLAYLTQLGEEMGDYG